MYNALNMYKHRLLIKAFPRFARSDFNCHICSFGGVGTSFFMEFMNRYYKTNDIEDYSEYKHINFPPRHSKRVRKVIYIYGDPIDATISLFRRNYARAQAHKNGNPFWLRNISLEEYVKVGRDRLFLTKHFHNWVNPSYRTYPVLLIRHEQLWENLTQIFELLDLPLTDVGNFPKRRDRASAKVKLDQHLRDRLKAVYADLYKKMEEYQAVEVI